MRGKKLIFHCFPRFQINDTFPDFTTSRDWYNLKVYPSPKEGPAVAISYNTHCSAVDTVHTAVGIVTSKKTHINRKSAAQAADKAGVDGADIARGGRWANSSLDTCYLTNLSFNTMRGLVGFSPDGLDVFYPRDVEVPDELLKQVFPQVDAWLAPFRSHLSNPN